MEPGEHVMTYHLGRRIHLNLGLLFSLPPSLSFFYESLLNLQLYPKSLTNFSGKEWNDYMLYSESLVQKK